MKLSRYDKFIEKLGYTPSSELLNNTRVKIEGELKSFLIDFVNGYDIKSYQELTVDLEKKRDDIKDIVNYYNDDLLDYNIEIEMCSIREYYSDRYNSFKYINFKNTKSVCDITTGIPRLNDNMIFIRREFGNRTEYSEKIYKNFIKSLVTQFDIVYDKQDYLSGNGQDGIVFNLDKYFKVYETSEKVFRINSFEDFTKNRFVMDFYKDMNKKLIDMNLISYYAYSTNNTYFSVYDRDVFFGRTKL